jgi:hypothetical protein
MFEKMRKLNEIHEEFEIQQERLRHENKMKHELKTSKAREV